MVPPTSHLTESLLALRFVALRCYSGIEFNAIDEGIIRARLCKGDDDLSTAISGGSELFRQSGLVARRRIDIKVTQHRTPINRHIEHPLSASLESQFRPIKLERVGLADL